MENLKFESISQFISFNKRVRGNDGNSISVNVNIPEMTDEQLISELELVCSVMTKAMDVMGGHTQKINIALAATTGSGRQVTPHEASKQFEKGFGILVKLNNEIVIRDLSARVTKTVQKTLGRKGCVAPDLNTEDRLMLE